ncbi:hypothetical protein ACFSTD_01500 [Novosphingobium colocasiae]
MAPGNATSPATGSLTSTCENVGKAGGLTPVNSPDIACRRQV